MIKQMTPLKITVCESISSSDADTVVQALAKAVFDTTQTLLSMPIPPQLRFQIGSQIFEELVKEHLTKFTLPVQHDIAVRAVSLVNAMESSL